MMANSFIDKLFPNHRELTQPFSMSLEQQLESTRLNSQFPPHITEGTAFDHWKGRGTLAKDWQPKLGETPHGTPAGQYQPKPGEQPVGTTTLSSPLPTGTEPETPTNLAKDDSRFSGDADTVVVTTIKETIANIKKCVSAGEYEDALQCVWTLRGLVMGYTDFKCGVICALKESKK